ncbi:MAG: hypothetical protein R2751_05270 [Bacteroidales bacterium]
MKGKKILFWVLAVVVSLAAMVYQRMTGPTYPKDYAIVHNETSHEFELPRSFGGDGDCPVELDLPDEISGRILWRRFPTEDTWTTIPMTREGDLLVGALPHQPPAGKLEYHLELQAGGHRIDLGDTENVVIRFKGAVPSWALIPHVLLMVLTVIWSTATILFALANLPVYKRTVGITVFLILLGGFVFGPIVQKYAFGQFWTGWPFGEDLTDNKTLLALLAFVAAWFLREKSYGRWIAVGAAAIMLAVYLIPHSMNGSELDPGTGQVVTGALALLVQPFRRMKQISRF